MASCPKRILVMLENLDTTLLPGWLLEHYGIGKDGVVALAMPRFPRVSDVKCALYQALGIPVKDQVLRGPLPSLIELSCNWAHLWEFEVLPGLDTSKLAMRDVIDSASLPTPGELFSTVPPLKARVHEGGALISDVLQLSTAHPINEYLPGGSIYRKRSRQKFMLKLLFNTLLVLLILGAVFYILWLVPGYEMPHPKRKKPSYWDNLTEEEMLERRRLQSDSLIGDGGATTNNKPQTAAGATRTLKNEL